MRALVSNTEIKASCLPTKMLPALLKDTNHTQCNSRAKNKEHFCFSDRVRKHTESSGCVQ